MHDQRPLQKSGAWNDCVQVRLRSCLCNIEFDSALPVSRDANQPSSRPSLFDTIITESRHNRLRDIVRGILLTSVIFNQVRDGRGLLGGLGMPAKVVPRDP